MTDEKRVKLRIGVSFYGLLTQRKSVMEVKDGEAIELDVPGAVKTLTALAAEGHTLYLIAFCGKQQRHQQVLDVLQAQLPKVFTACYFVLDGMFKDQVCSRLGCDVMVDTSSKVLANIAEWNAVQLAIRFTEPNGEAKVDSGSLSADLKLIHEGEDPPLYFRASSWEHVGQMCRALLPDDREPDTDVSLKGIVYKPALTEEQKSATPLTPYQLFEREQLPLQQELYPTLSQKQIENDLYWQWRQKSQATRRPYQEQAVKGGHKM
ncbi:Hypothetical protein POVN_LOCUS606 [uncultured virus]|nr:Hypothetical protein POVN_LOCUS606 [uncultured virus]